MRSRNSLPTVQASQQHSKRRPHDEVWLRISAFLSTRTPNTQDTYTGVIKEWCKFLGAEAATDQAARLLLSASDQNAIAYRNWLNQQPGERPRQLRAEVTITRTTGRGKKVGLESTLSNATIAKKFAVLRRLYRMFLGSGLGIKINPFDSDRVPAPSKEAGRKRPTEMVPFELVKKIIDSASTATPKGLRDRAILSALFGGALRRSEAATLRVGDVRKSPNGTIFLYLRSTKAKRDAEQALPKWAAATLAALVKQRVKDGAAAGDYLFVSYTGRGGRIATPEAVSTSGIYKLFKQYCTQAGAGEFVTPHSARATAITRLLSDGIPHRQVQEFSRHSSIQMVELYDKRRMVVDESPGKLLEFD